MRLLHAGHRDDLRGLPARASRTRATTRSAMCCRATCAAAPATTTSSRRSAGRAAPARSSRRASMPRPEFRHIGTRAAAQGRQAPADRHRTLRRRHRGARRAAGLLRALAARTRPHPVDRRRGGARDARASSPWSPATTSRAWTTRHSHGAADRGPAAGGDGHACRSTRCASTAIRSPASSPATAISPRTPPSRWPSTTRCCRPSPTCGSALEPDAPRVDETLASNLRVAPDAVHGDRRRPACARRTASSRARFSQHRQTHLPIETRGCIAVWDEGRAAPDVPCRHARCRIRTARSSPRGCGCRNRRSP